METEFPSEKENININKVENPGLNKTPITISYIPSSNHKGNKENNHNNIIESNDINDINEKSSGKLIIIIIINY